ncbi:hypothetical protein F0562_000335 [Nyssa sinensis]|uniref:SHSP domain-containing protein n=1 Tax=Nyssa sinensis TaxID=561372 RepID=A0A5J5C4X0_9ASTE|nr:hypothetical protein F0562_000335 [Nyssa sinensis]
MGEALFELEQILRSKQSQGTLTSQEANVLMTCKAKAIKDFTIGAGAGGSIAWIGAAAFFGLWKFGRSLDSCIEHILSLDGSRMQKELANIMLKKYQNNQWTYAAYLQAFLLGEEKTDLEKLELETKKVSMNPGLEAMANPLDCVFGIPGRVEEIHQPGISSIPPRGHGRSHKRSHRRHRMRHQRVSSNSQHAEAHNLRAPIASDSSPKLDDAIGDPVRARAVEIHPGVIKIVVRGGGGNNGDEVELLIEKLEVDAWRFRLPASTRPELASAVFVDGELVVTVPKSGGEFEDGGDIWGGVRRLILVQ